jgi:hypothetical protein
VFYRIAGGADTTTSVADTGNHTTAIKVVYRGVDTTNPIHATAGSVQATAATSWTLPEVVTTVQDSMIVLCIANDRDAASTANLSGWSNTNLTSLTERHDQTVTSAAGGGVGVADGLFGAIGSTGTTTVTNAASNTAAFITVAIQPEPRALVLDAQPDSLTLTGQDADLLYLRNLVLDSQSTSFNVTGQSTELIKSNSLNNYTLDSQPDSFVISGFNAELVLVRVLTLDAQSENFVLTGQDTTLNYLRALNLNAEFGNFSVSGQDTEFNYIRVLILNAEFGAFNVIEQTAGLYYADVKLLGADAGLFNIVGQNAVLGWGRVLPTEIGIYDQSNYLDPLHTDPAYVGGTDAVLAYHRSMDIQSTNLVLIGSDASLNKAKSSYSLTPVAMQRLTEIWARMELDATRPVTVNSIGLVVGTITQSLSTSGATRTGSELPIVDDADLLVTEIWQRLGLDSGNPLIQTPTTLTFGTVTCAITEVGGAITVTRNA